MARRQWIECPPWCEHSGPHDGHRVRVLVTARTWVDVVWDAEGQAWVEVSDQGRRATRYLPSEVAGVAEAMAAAGVLAMEPPGS